MLTSKFQTEASKQDRLKALTPEAKLNPAAFAAVFGDFQDMYLQLHAFASVGAALSSPVVDGAVVYVGNVDGKRYALD